MSIFFKSIAKSVKANTYACVKAASFTRVFAIVSTLVLASQSIAATPAEAVAERIKPFGSVCVAGDDCAKNLTVAAAGPKSGKEVYDTSCVACHASGAAGAPKFRDAADWSSRLSAGLDTVYANAINGIGAMPAKGLCGSCSDEEIQASVDYMIEGL